MKKEDFSKEAFRLKILLNASENEVFLKVATAKGLESWFLGNVQFKNKIEGIFNKDKICVSGADYVWKWQKNYQLSGTILNVELNRVLEFTFGKDFKVQFIISTNQKGNCTLHLNQFNLNPSKENEFSFINCCVCWTFFLTNLKSVIENNIDLRETTVFDETFINQ